MVAHVILESALGLNFGLGPGLDNKVRLHCDPNFRSILI